MRAYEGIHHAKRTAALRDGGLFLFADAAQDDAGTTGLMRSLGGGQTIREMHARLRSRCERLAAPEHALVEMAEPAQAGLAAVEKAWIHSLSGRTRGRQRIVCIPRARRYCAGQRGEEEERGQELE